MLPSHSPPPYDPSAPLQFVINGRAGRGDADTTRSAIEAALAAAGRAGTVVFAETRDLPQVAAERAATAHMTHAAVIAVGGDGTINTVAHAAHTANCAMGVLAGGTFNYVAREHGVPEALQDAVPWLLQAKPCAVPISAMNDAVFLVNASLGVYPDLLQDRERWKARFGRSRLVAFSAGLSTLLRAQDHWLLTMQVDGRERTVRALTVVIGNSRLQLQQLGLEEANAAPDVASHALTVVILEPVTNARMLTLIMRGALGTLGDADGVEHLVARELVVQPRTRLWGRTVVKVAFDGEVTWMRAPLHIRVLERPLWLLKPVDGRAAQTVATADGVRNAHSG